MLRSTSIKKESWKPVKLLARQTVSSPILSIDCDSKGDVSVALSESELNIFTNRELSKKIKIDNGRSVFVTKDSKLVIVLLEKKILCFDSWGQIQWEYAADFSIGKVCINDEGSIITVSSNDLVKSFNRFGEIIWEHTFSSKILDMGICELNNLTIATQNSVFVFRNSKEILQIKLDVNIENIFCSKDSIIAKSTKEIFCLSYSGTELWRQEVTDVSNFSFFRNGVKHIFLKDKKSVVCQDRNSDVLWSYSSTDKLSNLKCIDSGQMFCFNSNNIFHVLDGLGEQSWTYQAREQIVGFTFSDCGGDIILASEYKVHWFQNEGFLRFESKNNLDSAKELVEKIAIYEKNLDTILNDIDRAVSLNSGNFDSLRESFDILRNVNSRLFKLQKRHVEYLDSLPTFMQKLSLQGAQTDEMTSSLYPYYSLYNDLKEINYLRSLLETADYFLMKLNKYEQSNSDISNDKSKDLHFLKSAKKGITDEIANIETLILNSQKDALSLESKLRELILDWLKTGQIDVEPRKFTEDYYRSNDVRHLKHGLIKDKIENHMAFVDFSDIESLVKLQSFSFNCAEKINLTLNLTNESSETIKNLVLRIKLEGQGLTLFDPASGVARFEHLNPREKMSPKFLLKPFDRSYSRIVMVVQYIDSAGRRCTNWLGEAESNFLGCYIRPLDITEDQHGEYRLEFKDCNSHGILNVEGLAIDRITSISKEIPGMQLCNFKEESSRSIIYLAGESSLDESKYMAMIFLRKVGGQESLRTILELICHSTDVNNSSELRDEIISYLKNKLLSINGKLV
tara:strand:- start:660 stop:3044 length:2385 start_codon:yes stop_codon:yes gene_type:complete